MSNIQTLPLEDIMGERFGRYSKYIIQERALPDIRDGLKPVQRRILYSMNKDGNTFDAGYRKSAKSVGNVMGNFHPHGDSSIYDAMIRLSQDWKMQEPLIEMHGNNGSMDGDPPAAMRYTEARLSEISGFLLTDIEKETVPFVWNFDDTEKEPTVLPANVPNLLVNGSTGISAGYATDIPPHNLGEVIDATVYLIDHPTATTDRLMELIPGPDFPTGGIIQGKSEIKKAYETGKGRIVVRSLAEIEPLKVGRKQIVIHEIPYEVNKLKLIQRIDEIVINSKVPGILEARDESDREGLRIVIELKKEADENLVLNYLYKNTDLQVNYNFNMVAIDEMTPHQVGLITILKAYVAFRETVIVKRSKYNLGRAERRLHIVEGLIHMVSILDEVVALIRASENKGDAKANLTVSYGFSEEQAEAIVTLQLYRLTNTDILTLQKEEADLKEKILELNAIINDEKTLFNVMKKELREVKKKFGKPRRSELQDQVETIEIAATELVTEEETVVSVTAGGYVKRTSPRSFASSNLTELGKRQDDHAILIAERTKTTQSLLIFTNLGNVIYRPVHELKDIRWKDIGEHLSQGISNFENQEQVVFAQIVDDFENPKAAFVLATAAGQIKQVAQSDFKPWRTYKSKATLAIKLKGTEDRVVSAFSSQESDKLLLISKTGYALQFKQAEIPMLGARAAGVKAMNLKGEDELVAVYPVIAQSSYLLTTNGFIKRFKNEDILLSSRANRGLQVLKTLKTNPQSVFSAGNIEEAKIIGLLDEQPEKTPDVQRLIVQLENQEKPYELILTDLKIGERTAKGEAIDSGVLQVNNSFIQ